jgi:hypothetical protein
VTAVKDEELGGVKGGEVAYAGADAWLDLMKLVNQVVRVGEAVPDDIGEKLRTMWGLAMTGFSTISSSFSF